MTKHQGVICNTAAAIREAISAICKEYHHLFLQHINTKRFGLYIRNKSDDILKQNTLIFIKAESVSALFEECVTLSEAVEGIMWQEGISRQRGR